MFLITSSNLRINNTHPDYDIIKANILGWPFSTNLEIQVSEPHGAYLLFRSATVAGIDWGDIYDTIMKHVNDCKIPEIEIGRLTVTLDGDELTFSTMDSVISFSVSRQDLKRLGQFLLEGDDDLDNFV